MAFRGKASNDSDGSRNSSEDSNSDDDKPYVHWKRVRKNDQLPDLGAISSSNVEGRKVNTIWSDVHSEQELIRTVAGNVSLDRKNDRSTIKRGPESYSTVSKPYVKIDSVNSMIRKNLDEDLDAHTSKVSSDDVFGDVYTEAPEPLAPVSDSAKKLVSHYNHRKRPYHGRERSNERDRHEGHRSEEVQMHFNVKFDENDPVDKLGAKMCWALKETKQELILRCLKILGAEKCLEIYGAAEKIEKAGGMLITNGSRRRTPGGVFLYLVREDKTISDDIKKELFQLERENERKIAHARRKDFRRKKNFDELLVETKTKIEEGKMLRDKKDLFLSEALEKKDETEMKSCEEGEISYDELDVCPSSN